MDKWKCPNCGMEGYAVVMSDGHAVITWPETLAEVHVGEDGEPVVTKPKPIMPTQTSGRVPASGV